MELSQYVEGLRRELGSLTRFAPEEVAQVAHRLAEALDSSVRLTLLEVLSAAAAEITTKLDETVIDVRLNAGEPEFVVTTVPDPRAEPAGAGPDLAADEAGTARITLRLSEALKGRVEERAAAEGQSVNSWLAHAAIRALDDKQSGGGSRSQRSSSGIGQRITGYARS
jgi:hypothetical protein